MTFGNHFGMLFASIWAPKTTPKWDPKGSQHEIKKSSILLLFTTLAPHWGVLKIGIFLYFFGTLLDPFGHPKSTPKKTPKKETKKEPQDKPVLAREREARSNVRASSQARLNSSIAWACNNAPSTHSRIWRQRYSDQVNGPMRDTSTSCGLPPRLRRCLDHAEQLRKYRWNRWSNHTDIRTRNIKNPCETNDLHAWKPSLKVTKIPPK